MTAEIIIRRSDGSVIVSNIHPLDGSKATHRFTPVIIDRQDGIEVYAYEFKADVDPITPDDIANPLITQGGSL